MPHDLYEWLERIKEVEREHAVTHLATNRLRDVVLRDPTFLKGDMKPRDIATTLERLEGTYVVRLFAEFETGLRLFWTAVKKTDPPSRARDLLDGVAAKQRVPHDLLQNAHAVREYRNALVHEREEETPPIPIAKARGHLCTFLAFLPPK